jgi:hypothetical protein
MSSLEFQIGESAIRNYKRLDYEYWFALAEFVDNSIQAYINNKSELENSFKKTGEHLEIVITYDPKNLTLTIRDNSMGMNLKDLENGLIIGRPPSHTKGLSEFGMGLKTAACWLGDFWTVQTKKLGEDKEYEVSFDVEKVADGDTKLNLIERPSPRDHHYTVIKISKMHQKIAGNTLQKTKNYLRSLYRGYTRKNEKGESALDLKWGENEKLNFDEDVKFLKARNGEDFKKEFDFKVDGKRVYGWVGILPQRSGRPKAGFAVVRRNRVIQGQPTAWRPSTIYGQEGGSNDTINQRIFGEINLDDFLVTHTKNAILWRDEEEEFVEEKLHEISAAFMAIAEDARYRDNDVPETVIATGLAAAAEELERPEFVDTVNLHQVPTPEMVQAENQPVIDVIKNSSPDKIIKIGEVTVNVYMDPSFSRNDPYYLPDYYPNSPEISVSINTQHSFFRTHITTAESIKTFVLLCCYDAIAEWKCLSKTGQVEPKTVNSLKNEYMQMALND